MSKPIMLLTTIPFSGFYNSIWSDAIDNEEEQSAEYEADERQAENGIPEELRLSAQEICGIYFDVTNYRAAYMQIARDYAETFSAWAGEQLSMTRKAKRQRYDYAAKKSVSETYDADSIGLVFESMESPREYNFTTDSIFCHIPLKTVRALFKISKAESHARLSAAIAERFTSYDGFFSSYDNDVDSWLEKPLSEWDHNEISTLLIAMTGEPDDLDDMFYGMGDEWGYQAWESAVDWKKYESRVAELRAEKLAETQADNPDYIPPYHCPETPDLFNGESAT
ncbi:hypothetical protein G3A39_43180 [Paraburkholderia aspalathi]|nr:hypothetical protein [Paraburkholderia aspalathi]